MRVGSLFSGYGGLDLAVEAATGATPAWFCEFDEAPSKILNHHWPHVPNLHDVTQVDWSQVEPVEIITGGSPCQDLSQAGRRAGMTEGTRSNLWVNMREAIHHLKPQLVVWENVLGALSATATSDSDMEPSAGLLGSPTTGHLRALGRVLGDLTEIGYDTAWTTVRASEVGAPHHRARVFLIAWPSDSVLNPGHNARRAEFREQYEVPAPRPGEPGKDTADTAGESFGEHPGKPSSEETRAEGSYGPGDPSRKRFDGIGGKSPSDPEGGGFLPGINCAHNGPPHREVGAPRDNSVTSTDPERNNGGSGSVVGSGREARIGAPATGGPEHRCSSEDENPTDTTSQRAQVDGGFPRDSEQGDPSLVLGGDVLPDSHVVGPQAGHERTVGHGEEIPVSNCREQTLPDSGGGRWGEGTEQPAEAEGTPPTTDRYSVGIEWGEYAPAVRRWERIVGPAPAPTEPNSKGNPRLNAEFAEWMMGLPAGWVSGVPGLSRAEQLKAIGNGVCPQQAEAALSQLLEIISFEPIGRSA